MIFFLSFICCVFLFCGALVLLFTIYMQTTKTPLQSTVQYVIVLAGSYIYTVEKTNMAGNRGADYRVFDAQRTYARRSSYSHVVISPGTPRPGAFTCFPLIYGNNGVLFLFLFFAGVSAFFQALHGDGQRGFRGQGEPHSGVGDRNYRALPRRRREDRGKRGLARDSSRQGPGVVS